MIIVDAYSADHARETALEARTPGCCKSPGYLMRAAECALSETSAHQRAEELFRVAPNPFEQGRANEISRWRKAWSDHARHLIWC